MPLSDDLKNRIESLLQSDPVVLFMKGEPESPQCGFSARAVSILQALGVPFKAVNILADWELRQGLKEYSGWPTYPQLYVQGRLVGGSDIMWEMFQSGQLKSLFESAGCLKNASSESATSSSHS